jgi:hypothetical protein
MTKIFVFGSNLSGRHGKGAALHAKEVYGAVYGVGEGLTGEAYALPTKGDDQRLTVRPLIDIEMSIIKFLVTAGELNHLTFHVTPIGTGLAGYSKDTIRDLFQKFILPDNIVFTKEWFESS